MNVRAPMLALCLVPAAALGQGTCAVIQEGTTLSRPPAVPNANQVSLGARIANGTYIIIAGTRIALGPTGAVQLDASTAKPLTDAIKKAIGDGTKRSSLFLVYSQDQAPSAVTGTRFRTASEDSCESAYAEIVGGPGGSPQPVGAAVACSERADVTAFIETHANETVLIFDESLTPCYEHPDFPSLGSRINVAVLSEKPPTVTFTPCSVEETAPKVYSSGSLGALGLIEMSSEAKLWPVVPKRCYNKTVEIRVSTEGATGLHSLQQYELFRGTVQVGTLFTKLHDNEYGLRTVDGRKQVYDKGPVERGPEYTATLVVYNLWANLRSAFGGSRYAGRDILHDSRIADRIGGVVGLGLSDPGDRFVAGLSFEVFYGINGIVVHEWARVNRLALNSGAYDFVGEPADIPTTRAWEHAWVFGLSLDLRYIGALLSR